MAKLPDKARIREIMATVCEKNGVSELESQTSIEWNARFTSRMGDANYNKMRVRFSIPLFALAGEKDQEDTIAHEMAHIVARHKYGKKIKSHGGEWQACMLVAGYKPTRCHDIDTTGLKKSRKTCKTYCNCNTHMVTPKMYGDIAKGRGRICSKCKGRLTLQPKAVAPKPVATVVKPQGFKVVRKVPNNVNSK